MFLAQLLVFFFRWYLEKGRKADLEAVSGEESALSPAVEMEVPRQDGQSASPSHHEEHGVGGSRQRGGLSSDTERVEIQGGLKSHDEDKGMKQDS